MSLCLSSSKLRHVLFIPSSSIGSPDRLSISNKSFNHCGAIQACLSMTQPSRVFARFRPLCRLHSQTLSDCNVLVSHHCHHLGLLLEQTFFFFAIAALRCWKRLSLQLSQFRSLDFTLLFPAIGHAAVSLVHPFSLAVSQSSSRFLSFGFTAFIFPPACSASLLGSTEASGLESTECVCGSRRAGAFRNEFEFTMSRSRSRSPIRRMLVKRASCNTHVHGWTRKQQARHEGLTQCCMVFRRGTQDNMDLRIQESRQVSGKERDHPCARCGFCNDDGFPFSASIVKA